jgi:hypothetical protein
LLIPGVVGVLGTEGGDAKYDKRFDEGDPGVVIGFELPWTARFVSIRIFSP